MRKLIILSCCIVVTTFLYAQRNIISLNGEWQLDEGTAETVPEIFRYKAPVPGLVDLANTTFEEVGLKSEKREMFWYRKTFNIGEKKDIASLKIYQLMYGAKIFLNGHFIADQFSCFVPESYEVTNLLKYGKENELVIGVGAWLDYLPDEYPDGWDVEKVKYIPGICDDVELIYADYPFIEHIECVPDISENEVRVLAKIRNGPEAKEANLEFNVFGEDENETVSSKTGTVWLNTGEIRTIETVLEIDDAKLWSPENPYLYTLRLSTGGDSFITRFGMRSFRLDHRDGLSYLNEKPYYWRGTNINLLRFYEDPAREDLPWDRDWVRKLLTKFKDMNWNSVRMCLGFAPDFWYDIADEVGLLIQDEYPLWYVGNHEYGKWKSSCMDPYLLADQYEKWMKQRMNHASVVIWDAQNETVTPVTGHALTLVRDLDHSCRPWNNGWGYSMAFDDAMEFHPYLFNPKKQIPFEEWGNIKKLEQPMWFLPNLYKNPQVINEYSQLWLRRDGTPTVRGQMFYDMFFGENLSPQQYQYIYATWLAAETEMWRSLRQTFGVLHLAALGYAIPEAIVGDDFKDPRNLVMFDGFDTYVKDAFNPVGIMADFWQREVQSGQETDMEVSLINDTYLDWNGVVTLRIADDKQATVFEQQQSHVTLKSLGETRVPFEVQFPEKTGRYRLVAEITDNEGETVQSVRDFEIK